VSKGARRDLEHPAASADAIEFLIPLIVADEYLEGSLLFCVNPLLGGRAVSLVMAEHVVADIKIVAKDTAPMFWQ